MKTPGTLNHIKLAIFIIVLVLACPPLRAADPKPQERAIPYQRILVSEYQNFLGNWNEKTKPVLCAVIQTPAQYAALFHPAATMRNKRPFAPDAQLYQKEQILLVARVMPAPKNMEETFAVESVTAREEELVVKYRFNEANTDATFTVKNFLALRIPKHSYKKVTFIENGRKVGEVSGE